MKKVLGVRRWVLVTVIEGLRPNTQQPIPNTRPLKSLINEVFV